MKKILFILLIGFLLQSCDEIPPTIPDPPTGGDRIVLLEEFSGGSCVPCSDAAKIIKEISAQYPDNFIPIAIHTFQGGTYDPYQGAKYDFRTEKGQEVIEFLGIPLGIPSGAVNRKLFEGENSIQLPKSKWNSIVQNALSENPQININVNTTYEPATRMLSVDVNMVPLENISGDLKLIVLVNESHLIDKQAIPEAPGVDEAFEHNHVLRDVITSTNGEDLGTDLISQTPINKSFDYLVPSDDLDWWIPANMEVVAFVVNNVGDSKEVLQAASAYFTE